MRTLPTLALFTALILMNFSASAASTRQERLQGPVQAEVLQVMDGDTVEVKAHVWIGAMIETSVRINGIDAPEIKGKCEKERQMAEAAKQEIINLTQAGKVTISDIRLEKYAGRVLARIETADGIDLGKYLIEKGFARPYHGEKRKPWCA